MNNFLPQAADRRKLLEIADLSITVGRGGRVVVKNVSFSLSPGEVVAIVGESGSGKTQVARAVLGLTPSPLVVAGGSKILFDGIEIHGASPKTLQSIRGARIGMVFQEPMTSLNPSLRIGAQLDEGLSLHNPKLSRTERRKLIIAMLERVGIKDPEAAMKAWPHEFSGGMRQRIMLAAVMLLEPDLLVADEPTTALDALVQKEVLELMVELTRNRNTAVLLISHDLPMVAQYTERVIVMRAGEIVESGSTKQLLADPKHEYTQRLLASMPQRRPPRHIPFAWPIVEVENLVVEYKGQGGMFRKAVAFRALHGISVSIRPGEVVAVVGGSGSGKTTLGRTIAGLIEPAAGTLRFKGSSTRQSRGTWNDYRLNCQMVFQDPHSSLDPRMSVGALVEEGLRHVPNLSDRDKRIRRDATLTDVGLDLSYANRFPHELSGGQRQRVAIARAIVRRPAFVIADEPVSALDVTVRAQVLDLFAELQQKHGFSCLFISHDLAAVEQIADRVIVMHQGKVEEEGSRDDIFDRPASAYTKRLLAAIPALESNGRGGAAIRWRVSGECPHAASAVAAG